jgi:hypothetical protein
MIYIIYKPMSVISRCPEFQLQLGNGIPMVNSTIGFRRKSNAFGGGFEFDVPDCHPFAMLHLSSR